MKPLHLLAIVGVGWYLHSHEGIDLWTADGWRRLLALLPGHHDAGGACCSACAQAAAASSAPAPGATMPPMATAPTDATPSVVTGPDIVAQIFQRQAAISYAKAGGCAGGAC